MILSKEEMHNEFAYNMTILPAADDRERGAVCPVPR